MKRKFTRGTNRAVFFPHRHNKKKKLFFIETFAKAFFFFFTKKEDKNLKKFCKVKMLKGAQQQRLCQRVARRNSQSVAPPPLHPPSRICSSGVVLFSLRFNVSMLHTTIKLTPAPPCQYTPPHLTIMYQIFKYYHVKSILYANIYEYDECIVCISSEIFLK